MLQKCPPADNDHLAAEAIRINDSSAASVDYTLDDSQYFLATKNQNFTQKNHKIEAIRTQKDVNVDPYVGHCDCLRLKPLFFVD